LLSIGIEYLVEPPQRGPLGLARSVFWPPHEQLCADLLAGCCTFFCAVGTIAVPRGHSRAAAERTAKYLGHDARLAADGVVLGGLRSDDHVQVDSPSDHD